MKNDSSDRAAELLTEGATLLLGAVALHCQRIFMIQANHGDIAGAVDLPMVIADGYRKGLTACGNHKCPQFLKRPDQYLKFLHGFPFLRLYKLATCVYNGSNGSFPHPYLL